MEKTILIVDDAAFMRMSLQRILEPHGFKVIGQAANGKEAVEQYKLLSPDLVVMDITMPDMNGIDALREIRKVNPEAAVLMCSAMGQMEKVVETIEAGARDFIVKPFQNDRVVAAVQKILM